MTTSRTREICPVCGSERVRRILWGWVSLTSDERNDVEAGRVILGGRKRGMVKKPDQSLDVPEWACIDCQPGWAEVHRMAVEADELEQAKERAIEAHDFELAARLLHRQDEIDDRISELVRRFTNE
jgi:hypothetical protein